MNGVNTNKTIFLCGFMGCGKSTIGRRVSQKLKRRFIDLDAHIEKTAGMKIADIFKAKGEEHFRKLETDAINEFAANENLVVALGGGAIINPANAELIKSRAVSVFIDCDFDVCYRRIKGDVNRPLAATKTREEVLELYNTRKPVYKKHSVFTVNGNNTVNKIAEEISKKVAD